MFSHLENDLKLKLYVNNNYKMIEFSEINIFGFALFIGLTPFWHFSLDIFNRFSSRFDIAKNANHFLHAILFVSLFRLRSLIDITHLIILSISFYSYDLIYIIYTLTKLKEKFSKQLPFIIHHFIANYGLYLALVDYFREHILYLYYLLELSNFMLYTSYYISKRWKDYKNLQLVSCSFQFIWYSYFRIIRYSIYMYKIWDIFLLTDIYVKLANAILFLMGFYWSFNLFKKILK